MAEAPTNSAFAEITRLNALIKTYESDNLRLKSDLKDAVDGKKNVLRDIDRSTKEKIGLSRQITSLENASKIEKKVVEGLLKKSGVLDFDVTSLREENAVLKKRDVSNTKRVEELEKTLIEDRTKRLREMHLNEVLRKKNSELEAKMRVDESNNKKYQDMMLDKFQEMETIIANNHRLQRLVEVQSEDILRMTKEVHDLKEKIKNHHEQVSTMKNEITNTTKERDEMQNEVWRLRSEVLSIAGTSNEKSVAFNTFSPNSRASSRFGSSRPTTTSSSRLRPLTSGTGSDYEGFPFDASASPKGTRSPKGDSGFGRSLFVGSGLGLKQDTAPVVPSKGGAKAVLKKILDEFYENQ